MTTPNDRFLLCIPRELLLLISQLLNPSMIFSLSRSSKKYLQLSIQSLSKSSMKDIQLDAIINGYCRLFKWLVNTKEVRTSIKSYYEGMHHNYTRVAIEYDQLEILDYLRVTCKWSRD